MLSLLSKNLLYIYLSSNYGTNLWQTSQSCEGCSWNPRGACQSEGKIESYLANETMCFSLRDPQVSPQNDEYQGKGRC